MHNGNRLSAAVCFSNLSKQFLVDVHAALFAALLRSLRLCCWEWSNVGRVSSYTKKERLNDVQSAMQNISTPCAHVPPCLLKTVFGFFSYSLAVLLISSRQPVWRGLKAFTEPSPGLINTHFPLEILAQTHHRFGLIRCWHWVQPWLKRGHCSIQYLLHIMQQDLHQFVLSSKGLLQKSPTSFFVFLFTSTVSSSSCSSMHS